MDVRNVYINSTNRDPGGTPVSFTITKPYNVFNQVPKRAKLLSARIPFTWNNVTAGNNQFTLIEYPGRILYPVTIPVGYYEAGALAAIIQTALNALGGYTYTVTYTDFVFNFTAAGNTFQFDFTNFGLLLGFPIGMTSVGISLTSPNAANVLGDLQICITSNLIGGIDNGIVPWTPGAPVDQHILAMIPLCSCRGGIIKYQASQSEPWQNVTQSVFSAQSRLNNPVVMTFSLMFLSGNQVSVAANWDANVLLEF